jgi:biopolymer transport protein ExbB
MADMILRAQHAGPPIKQQAIHAAIPTINFRGCFMMRRFRLVAAAPFACVFFCGHASAAQELTFTGMILSAGLAIVPIIGLSILALAVTIERLRNCRRDKIFRNGLSESVITHWKAGEFDAIARRLQADDSVLARVLAHILAHRHLPAGMVASGAGDVASHALRAHLQRVYPLAVTATVAPIVGLLGTVIGMIEAFHVIAFAGMGDPTLLAGGISKALVNTAAGLSVALPALLVYHFFKNRIVNCGLELEQEVNRVINACLYEGGKPIAPATEVENVPANAVAPLVPHAG